MKLFRKQIFSKKQAVCNSRYKTACFFYINLPPILRFDGIAYKVIRVAFAHSAIHLRADVFGPTITASRLQSYTALP